MADDTKPCSKCGGTGQIGNPGALGFASSACWACNGSGKVPK